jgi:hypothetical protein
MNGDMEMVKRFSDSNKTLETLPDWVSAPPVKEFDIHDLIPQSIDFHCSPSIITWINKKTGISTMLIKQEIWEHWSSPNVRQQIGINRQQIGDESSDSIDCLYVQIKPLLEQYSQLIISDICKTFEFESSQPQPKPTHQHQSKQLKINTFFKKI